MCDMLVMNHRIVDVRDRKVPLSRLVHLTVNMGLFPKNKTTSDLSSSVFKRLMV